MRKKGKKKRAWIVIHDLCHLHIVLPLPRPISYALPVIRHFFCYSLFCSSPLSISFHHDYIKYFSRWAWTWTSRFPLHLFLTRTAQPSRVTCLPTLASFHFFLSPPYYYRWSSFHPKSRNLRYGSAIAMFCCSACNIARGGKALSEKSLLLYTKSSALCVEQRDFYYQLIMLEKPRLHFGFFKNNMKIGLIYAHGNFALTNAIILTKFATSTKQYF